MKKKEKNIEELKLITEFYDLRKSLKLTQKDLERLTGMSQSTIARIENKSHSASLNTITKLLKGLVYHLEIKKDLEEN